MTQATNRRDVSKALRRLSYRERTQLTKEAIAQAIENLPEPDCHAIPAIADELAASMNKMGSLLALEVLAAVGMLWSENGE